MTVSPSAAPTFLSALAGLTLALGAALLFWLEFIVARPLLIRFGGAPQFWLTFLSLFQVLLYFGYLLSHLAHRRLSPRLRASLTCILFAFALLWQHKLRDLCPAAPDSSWPILSASLELLRVCGPPFLALSTLTPLLAGWLAKTLPDKASYSLLSASNLGSMIALIAFPTTLEPLLDQAQQESLWLALFTALSLALFVLSARLAAQTEAPSPPQEAAKKEQRRRWRLRAALTSALLHALTQLLTRDLVAVPMLWVIPLALYLLSFIIAFAPRRFRSLEGALRIILWPLAALSATLALPNLPLPAGIERPALILHLLVAFLLFWLAHADLADEQPPQSQITDYTLELALGGALGGLGIATLAPSLFLQPFEASLCIALTLSITPQHESPQWTRRRRYAGLGFAIAILLVAFDPNQLIHSWLALLTSGVLIATLLRDFPERRSELLALAAIAWIFPGLTLHPDLRELHISRSIYGVARVRHSPKDQLNRLTHGTTIHGQQLIADPDCPTGYYAKSGPAGDIMSLPSHKSIAVIGLGVGTLIAYSKAEQHWTFFELDPTIAQIAENQNYFSYLNRSKAPYKILLGDGRLVLQQLPDSTTAFDLIVLDAFSSDAIPLHLLSAEAFAVYQSRLSHSGLIAIHISNRFIDLEPVLAAWAEKNNWIALIRHFNQPKAPWESSSDWVVLSPKEANLGSLKHNERWTVTRADTKVTLWTDSFSSLWPVLRWN